MNRPKGLTDMHHHNAYRGDSPYQFEGVIADVKLLTHSQAGVPRWALTFENDGTYCTQFNAPISYAVEAFEPGQRVRVTLDPMGDIIMLVLLAEAAPEPVDRGQGALMNIAASWDIEGDPDAPDNSVAEYLAHNADDDQATYAAALAATSDDIARLVDHINGGRS